MKHLTRKAARPEYGRVSLLRLTSKVKPGFPRFNWSLLSGKRKSFQGSGIQAFVFNWSGYAKKARLLECQISQFLPVTVINSDPSVSREFPHWIQLNSEAYYSEQFNSALDRFDGDIYFQVQADARPNDVRSLLKSALRSFHEHNAGIFVPKVDFSNWDYPQEKLPFIEDSLAEIPMCDSTCWFIHHSILSQFSKVDHLQNKYGWGIDPVLSALCHMQGKRIICDFSQKVDHPRQRNYSDSLALAQMETYFTQLDPIVVAKARAVIANAWALSVIERA